MATIFMGATKAHCQLVRAVTEGEPGDITIRFYSLDWQTEAVQVGYDDARSIGVEDADELLTELLLASVEARRERPGTVEIPPPLVDALGEFLDQFNMTVQPRDPGSGGSESGAAAGQATRAGEVAA